MASRHTLQKECDRYNAVRQVRFHRGACSLEGFWSSARGNFLLTGGTESRRSEILAEGIREMAGTARGPIVVLYTSLDLENRLIQMAQKGELPGYLTVSSPRYRNCEPLRGLNDQQILQLLLQTGQALNMPDMAGLSAYGNAFLKVLQSFYRPSLSVLEALATHSDEEIARMARAIPGSGPALAGVLRNQTNGGLALRGLLPMLRSACGEVSCGRETGYSLACLSGEPQVCLMWMNSSQPLLFRQILAMELQALLGRCSGATLLFHCPPPLNQDPLETVFQQIASGMGGARLGVSAGNALSWLQPWTGRESCPGLFPAQIILCDGAGDQASQDLLGTLGGYQHYEVVSSVSTPPGFFPMPWDIQKSYSISSRWRQRLLPEDVIGYEVVLSGHAGNQVDVWSGLKTDPVTTLAPKSLS